MNNRKAPCLCMDHLTFTYPEQPSPALRDFSLTIRQGEFVVLCGPSGCGKSTLLRQLKRALAPHGKRGGTILFEGKLLGELDQRTESQRIGFVQQSPENQVVTDLTALVGMEGMTELASDQLALYAFFIAALFLFAACITRRSHRPDYLVQTPREKRKLSRRTLFATALILLLIPLTLYVGVFYLDNKKYYFISLMVLLECMAPFFLIFEGRKPKARELVIIAVLCAIAIAGRAALFMLPQFKPVIAMTIISGVAFGGETGFLVGAMTMLASNVMFSQGPWTPWQMFAVGIIGIFAGVLFRKGWLRRSRGALCVFGALSAILIYGGIMNPASALMWAPELNWKVILTYYVTGFPFDCIQAAATWLFLWFAAEPMLEKLDRIKVKYGLVE